MSTFELVNVSGHRPERFTAEVIVEPAEGGFGLVGIHEDKEEGNFLPGISVYTVTEADLERTGQSVTYNEGDDVTQNFTPQLV